MLDLQGCYFSVGGLSILFYLVKQAMIKLQEMAVYKKVIWFKSGLVDLKNQLLLISFSSFFDVS